MTLLMVICHCIAGVVYF